LGKAGCAFIELSSSGFSPGARIGTNFHFLAHGGMPELKMKAANGFYSDDSIVEARIKERAAA